MRPIPYYKSLSRLVGDLRLAASANPPYEGRPSDTITKCRAVLADRQLSRDFEALVIFTRDTGHHSSGWWKNPDYERCYHLSLSFHDVETTQPASHQTALAERIARAFFGDNVSKLWIEPPYSDEGRTRDVYHYRLFCDQGWQPIVPRGEVYSRELTERGWKSWSDLHNGEPCEHHDELLEKKLEEVSR